MELDLLREHLTRVTRGEPGRAVLLVGESGVGKSRLAEEVHAEANRRGMMVVSARCVGRGAEPLLPVKDALAAYLGRSPEWIRHTLQSAAPRLLDSIPFIGAFLGKVGDAIVGRRQVPLASMEGVYDELARILLGIAEKRGLCLLVEDLHAADQDTLFFLNYLLRKIGDHRVLAVLTIQEEQLPDVPELADMVSEWTVAGFAVLTMLPLERAHVGEYVNRTTALGGRADDALVDRLFGLTGGNPFFLKETLLLLAQTSERGSATAGEGSLGVPGRTDAVLQRRLGRADADTRRFLEAAAVVLETAQELDPIAYVMGVDTGTAIQALTAARNLRLVREGPHGELSFVHALMQRAVYAEMGINQRRYLHGRAGEYFENVELLASAAFHFERAERTRDMVRTAVRAASHAEHSGMYHSALMFYQKARPFMEIEELGPLLGRALIVLGDWQEAEQLVDQLPAGDDRVRLLRSELRFVRGDFHGARTEAEAALDSRTADRLGVLTRLADIDLYLGRFISAQRYGHDALQEARLSGNANQRARCLGILGATRFFAGEVDEGAALFSQALELIEQLPEGNRDRTIHTTVLGNLGNVSEANGDWTAAERYHAEALRLRREVADVRGALHSLHAVGRCRIALGNLDEGLAIFADAERLAADLDETLERAKIAHSRAELRLRDGDPRGAWELATTALDTFARSCTHYDVTHARVTLSAAASAGSWERDSVEYGAAARASIEHQGYGLLRRQYPGVAYQFGDRIGGALTAYACGDALGLPYEGSPPSSVDTAAEIEELPEREGWPRGATSDDTALTLLAANHLARRDGAGNALAFLRELAERSATIRGIGPSTTAAIEHFHETSRLPATGGGTNGAPMRALPVGWATPLDEVRRRRSLAFEMTRATHPDPDALCAAAVLAACASWAIEGASAQLLLAVAVEEEAEAAGECGAGRRLAGMLAELAAGTWRPPEQGVSLDASETVTAVLACVLRASTLRAGLRHAVALGGDTDTVAALVGGLLGARLSPSEVRTQLPWHDVVRLPDTTEIAHVARTLAATRASG
ncbi:MAG: ATP-binding protein [Sciscionella sp.]